MKNINAANLYKNTDQMKVAQPDANSILVNCFDELIKSVKIFQMNIVPSTENFRKKSSDFFKNLILQKSRFFNSFHILSHRF